MSGARIEVENLGKLTPEVGKALGFSRESQESANLLRIAVFVPKLEQTVAFFSVMETDSLPDREVEQFFAYLLEMVGEVMRSYAPKP